MTSNYQLFIRRTGKLEEWLILAYALAVFLPITYVWIVLILNMVVFVLRLIVRGDAETFDSKAAWNTVIRAPLAIAILVFAIVTLLTGFANGGIGEAVSSLLTLRALLIYFVAYGVLSHNPVLLVKVLSVLLGAGAIAGVWGTIQQLFDFHPFEKFKYLQASGFMGNPMAYAGQMEITACLSVAIVLSGAYKHLPFFKGNRSVFIVVTACNLAGLFFASERSAWLGALVALLTMSCLVSFKVFFRAILALMAMAGISWFTVPVVQKRLVPMMTNIEGDVGVQARFVVWQKALEVWREHPIFGVGVKNFPKLDIPEAIVPGESSFLVHAHNNVLHIAATMGAVGLLSFVYMQLSILMLSFKTWTGKAFAPSPDQEYLHLQRAIGLGILGAMVSLMVAGCFEYNFGTGHVRLLQWFVLAMLISPYVRSKRGP